MTNVASQGKTPFSFSAAAWRLLLLSAFWWLLNTSDGQSWLIGGPAVIAAAALSFKLTPARSRRWRPLALLRFIPFFLLESLRGGWDVSLRVLRPSLPIHPGLFRYSTRLAPGMPRIMLLNTASLLPGTLSADLQDDCLTLHVLDTDSSVAADMKRLEDRIAAIFHTVGNSR